MLDLNQLTVFIRVVDEGSFTAAGKALGMPKSRVSRMVADLEASLGARLLQRTTRQLSMTEVGSAYYSRCRHLVHEIFEAHEMISDREGNPQGLLRIAVPMMAGSGVMGHYFARYQAQYPDVRLEVIHTDRPVNLIQEGFDLGVYLGDLPDSSLIARTLAESDSVLCAAPSYLARVGRPLHPHDLVQMRCVKIGEGSQPQTYELTHNETGEVVEVKVEPTISTNSVVAALGSMVQGAGIGDVHYLLAGEQFLNGQLVPLFTDWRLRPQPISLAYPSRQYLPRKVRVFIDFMVEEAQRLERVLDSLPTTEEQITAFAKLLRNEERKP